MQDFSIKSVAISSVAGSLITLLMAYASGSSFAALPFPIMAVLAGFLITGILEGLVSKDVNLLEPTISAVVVSVVLYFALPAMQLRGFYDMTTTLLLVMLMNGIVLAALGGWAGEKLHGTIQYGVNEEPVEWGWALCGIILGVTATMFTTSTLVIFLGFKLMEHFIAYVIGLFLAGFIIGLRSRGIIFEEAGIAGFTTVVINVDIVCIALGMLELPVIAGGLVIGIIATYLGGWIGERVHSSRSPHPTRQSNSLFGAMLVPRSK
ncbi:MAG: hypothetical protein MUF71_20060 [Candidatus Kapabacteria bacterium]|jgi:hypothetical protein|nr:hypothetical protein [Candidatus Kapabacteria bacterium]